MIDIAKVRYFSYFTSFLMFILLGFGIFYKNKQRGEAFLYSVEFSGGVQIQFSSEKESKLTTEEIAKLLNKKDYSEGASVRQFSKNEFLVRIPHREEREEAPSIIAEKIKTVLEENLKSEIKIIDVSFVGAGIGEQLKLKAIISVILALLMMSFYVWIRFKSFAFSFANVISLLHDILSIILLLLWFDFEISLDIVGAILFILGYSINDTIVIFSRIRENMEERSDLKSDPRKLINTSIKETLRRTLLTSFFTTLVVFPLWLKGGSSLESLSAPILLGIIFGTYSSIGIACSVLYDYFKCSKNKMAF